MATTASNGPLTATVFVGTHIDRPLNKRLRQIAADRNLSKAELFRDVLEREVRKDDRKRTALESK